jgi:hypothetical protein
MHSRRGASAPRTRRTHCPRARRDPHNTVDLLDPIDHHVEQVRQQNTKVMIIARPNMITELQPRPCTGAMLITKYGPEPVAVLDVLAGTFEDQPDHGAADYSWGFGLRG